MESFKSQESSLSHESWSRKRTITRNNYRQSGLGMASSGEALQGLEIKFLSVSHRLCLAEQTLVHETFALPLWSFRDIHPLLLSPGWHISLNCLTTCEPPTLMELSYVHNSICFSPVYLSYVHLTNRPAKSTQKERRGKFSSSVLAKPKVFVTWFLTQKVCLSLT